MSASEGAIVHHTFHPNIPYIMKGKSDGSERNVGQVPTPLFNIIVFARELTLKLVKCKGEKSVWEGITY